LEGSAKKVWGLARVRTCVRVDQALESKEASLDGLHEATFAMSALAHEPERWEALLRRLAKL
jgi:hypothetical protein